MRPGSWRPKNEADKQARRDSGAYERKAGDLQAEAKSAPHPETKHDPEVLKKLGEAFEAFERLPVHDTARLRTNLAGQLKGYMQRNQTGKIVPGGATALGPGRIKIEFESGKRTTFYLKETTTGILWWKNTTYSWHTEA